MLNMNACLEANCCFFWPICSFARDGMPLMRRWPIGHVILPSGVEGTCTDKTILTYTYTYTRIYIQIDIYLHSYNLPPVSEAASTWQNTRIYHQTTSTTVAAGCTYQKHIYHLRTRLVSTAASTRQNTHFSHLPASTSTPTLSTQKNKQTYLPSTTTLALSAPQNTLTPIYHPLPLYLPAKPATSTIYQHLPQPPLYLPIKTLLPPR